MNIKVEIIEPTRKNKFAEIRLSYKIEKELFESILSIDYNDVYEFTNDITSISFDLFFVSSIVYGIDSLVSRKYSDDGWSRNLEITIPVRNIAKLKRIENHLSSAVSFLTGDYWQIKFVKNDKTLLIKEKKDKQEDLFSFDDVSLFSGGMDSLIGIINYLESKPTKKLILISHYGYPRTVSTDQDKVFSELKTYYDSRIRHIKCRVNLNRKNEDLDLDVNFRSRSFLFISIGQIVASSLNTNPSLMMSENGSISLNFPLSKSRMSSCSTRTTHPSFIKMMIDIFQKCSINTPLVNNYLLFTKGEMINNMKNKMQYIKLMENSNSCTKRGHTNIWERKPINGAFHCGFCLPCLYRRAAYNKISKDDSTKYGVDVFNEREIKLNSVNSKRNHDFKALLSSLNHNYTDDQISSILLFNGVNELDKIGDYVNTVKKTRNELISLIKEKGTRKIKLLAGIND